jgi:shikimate kinase
MAVKKNIFLIGPMGAGKTSIGKRLANILNFDFFDSDQVIEEQAGADIAWIFDIEGEEGFRIREMKIIEQLTRKNRIVLATGGGVILKSENRRNLAGNGQVFYLNVSVEEQARRVYRSKNRPLILNENPKKIFERLKDEREPLYLEIADFIINTSLGSLKSIVDNMLKKYYLV